MGDCGEKCVTLWRNINLQTVAMRFLGGIEARIDAKGRVFLPSVFRKVLQGLGEERLVLRRDVFQSCLVLYPESVWNGQMDDMRLKLNRWNKTHQQIFRQFVSEAETVVLDGNGRFLISKRCLQAAGISTDVRFIGMGDSIEIWSSEACDSAMMDPEQFGNILEELMDSGSGGEL